MNDGGSLGWSPGKDFHGGLYLVGLITGVSALRGEARQTGKPLCSAECLKIFLKNFIGGWYPRVWKTVDFVGIFHRRAVLHHETWNDLRPSFALVARVAAHGANAPEVIFVDGIYHQQHFSRGLLQWRVVGKLIPRRCAV